MTGAPADMGEFRPVDVSERVFLALIAILPIMQPLNIEFHGYTIPPADFLFPIAASAAVLSVLSGRAPLPRSPVLWALGMYGAVFCASAAASPDRAHSFLKLLGTFYLIGLAALTIFHVRSLDAMRRALIAWLVGTGVTVVGALAGLILFAGGVTDPQVNLFLSIHGSLPEGAYPRVQGLFLNPNMYCAYLVASLAILVAARQAGWIRRGSVPLAGAIAIAAVSSLSPGLGGLLLVVAYGVWCEWRDTRPRLVKLVVAGSAIGAILFLVAITASPATGTPLTAWQLRPSSRVLTWIGSFKTFLAHPWLGKGVGLDAVDIGYINPSGIYERLTDAHNAWLSVLAETGLAGFIALVAIVAVSLRGTLPLSVNRSETIVRSGMAVAFGAGFLFQSLSGSFEDTRHVWVLIGMLAASKVLAERQASTGPAKPGPPAAT